jgi:ubiquinone/menaquinone biosynthesis C-methylase UbiE/glycosyltransferase involved in cell wall biosynthesis
MNPFLLISSDLIDDRMAGQGIRCLELAKVLARHVPVRLAVPQRCTIEIPGVEIVLYEYGDTGTLERACQGVSAVFAEPFILYAHPTIFNSELPLVIDLYNPFVLEHLSVHQELGIEQQIKRFYENVELCNAVCARGDFFTCATERQRDWWLGVLQANGRVNPLTVATDPYLQRLIAVVAYGVTAPSLTDQETFGPKATLSSLLPEDKLILWGGGLWNWLDPLTLIRALPLVLASEPRAKILFPGTRHPNTTIVPDMAMRHKAEQLAEELGLRDRHIIFGDWVPYEQWDSYLADADVAVSFHHETPETRFAALRSRIFGYLGSRLPMVVQTGDRAGEIVQAYGLGEVVAPNDPQAAAEALVRVLNAGKATYADRFIPLLETLSWEQVAAPLVTFALAPYLASDRTLQRGVGVHLVEAQVDDATQSEINRLQALVHGYENGRMMRLLSRLDAVRALPSRLRAMRLNSIASQTPAPDLLRPHFQSRSKREAIAQMVRMTKTLNFTGIRREIDKYAEWKLTPLRRMSERQLRRVRRRRPTDEAPTRLHQLYTYQLFDLGNQHPSLNGIYTPGYRSETLDNYLQDQFTDNAEVYAQKYTDYGYITSQLEPVLRDIGFLSLPQSTILDIGSGAGNSIFPLLELCPNSHIIASDLSIQLLKILQVALQGTGYERRVNLLQLNAEELDFAPESLDLVVGVAVLHHLFEPERTIAGCAKILKKGGHIILMEPFAEGCLTIARLYRMILGHPRASDLHERVRVMLYQVAYDFEVRAIPDKTLPFFNHLDDKQLFSRAYFEEQSRRYKFSSCTITPLNNHEQQYEEQTKTYLRITGVGEIATLPEWAWDIIRAEDARLTEAVPIEACVVLRK